MLSPWEDEPANNKEIDGLPTSWLPSNIVAAMQFWLHNIIHMTPYLVPEVIMMLADACMGCHNAMCILNWISILITYLEISMAILRITFSSTKMFWHHKLPLQIVGNNVWFCSQQCPCFYFSGLVQERRNSIANALELCLSCTNPLMWSCILRHLQAQWCTVWTNHIALVPVKQPWRIWVYLSHWSELMTEAQQNPNQSSTNLYAYSVGCTVLTTSMPSNLPASYNSYINLTY